MLHTPAASACGLAASAATLMPAIPASTATTATIEARGEGGSWVHRLTRRTLYDHAVLRRKQVAPAPGEVQYGQMICSSPPRRALLAFATVTLACLLSFAHPRVAEADCGGVQSAPAKNWHRPYRPPLAIGDSTMLLALPQLTASGFDVNAHGCRQFAEALTLMSGLARAGRLPHLVVIALGADGSVTPGDIAETLRILGRSRQLVLVTPRELGGGSGSDAETVRASVRTRPLQIHVVDWVHESEGHPEWFQPDGLHLTFSGADAFARSLRRALAYAAPSPAPLDCRSPAAALGASIDPAEPRVQPPASDGHLHVDEAHGTTALVLANANPFAVYGRAQLYPTSTKGRGAPADRLIAEACVKLAAGATGRVKLTLTPYGSEQVALLQRLTVRFMLTLDSPAPHPVKIVGAYVLERPRRH